MFDQGVAQKVWVIDQYYATWAELGESQTESELLFTINCKRNRKETVNIVNNICSFSLLRPTPLHSTPLLSTILSFWPGQFVIFRISFAYTSLTSDGGEELASVRLNGSWIVEADKAKWVAASLEPGPLEIYVPFWQRPSL